MKQKIEGVILYDTTGKKFIHREFITEDHLKKGMFPEYIFICKHSVEFESGDIDLIKPQLAGLDAKEKELTFKYNQALQHIKVQRNNLLALEN